MNEEMRQKMIQKYHSDLDVMRLKRVFNSQSILEVVGIERKEIRHSKFIKWLFNQRDINSGQDSAIMHFLDIVIRRGIEQNNRVIDDYKDDVLYRKFELLNVSASVEVHTDGVIVSGKKGSIDILIHADMKYGNITKRLSICIENKILSNEHDDQTWKYYAYLSNDKQIPIKDAKLNSKYVKANNEIQVFVFLQPLSNYELCNLTNRCECNKFVHINYQDIVTYVLSPILQNEETPSFIINHIKQYENSLGIPTIENNQRLNKMKSVMAVSEEAKCLAERIYKNQELFIKRVILDDNLKELKVSQKSFISNLLLAISISNDNLYDFKVKELKYLMMKLDDISVYLVKEDGNIEIYNQSELAIRFATYYINNFSKSIADYNKDFVSVYRNSFVNYCGQLNQYQDFTNLCKPPKAGIYFRNNCWSLQYIVKLRNFVKGCSCPNFHIFEEEELYSLCDAKERLSQLS